SLVLHSILLFLRVLRPPRPTLFPYTTLFRSVGDRVLALGCGNPNEVPAARHIVLQNPNPEPEPTVCESTVAFAGPVESINVDAATLVVGERTVQVTDDTIITKREDGRVRLADIPVGAIAFVEGNPSDDVIIRSEEHTSELQ